MTAENHIQHDPGAPLSGRSVVITRTRQQSRALAEPLEALGATVLSMPVLEIADPLDIGPLDDAIRELTSYDWVVLTSTNAVERFFGRLVFVDRTAEALSHVRVAAVGRATAERMRRFGVAPDLVPDDFRAEGLVEAFRAMGPEACARVLIPRAVEAREVLPDALREMGCHVDVVALYRTVPAEPDAETLAALAAGGVDAVAFTSGAIGKAFFSAVEGAGMDAREVLERTAVASVGPVTSDALRALGVTVAIEATESTMESLAEAIGEYFSAGS